MLGAVILILLSSIAIRERKYEIGVLRAIGMKKRKVALGLWTEMIVITCICLVIGIGVGASITQPVTNSLLAGQIENAKAADNSAAQGKAVVVAGTGGNSLNNSIKLLEELNVSLEMDTLMEIIGISLLLASIAGITAISRITKYEPIKILMERN
ncbi:hypothetical protein B1222_02040 [Paenibacillus larvae subsp. pulvifaciens]|nr:FtsX-like permease family protein [Paenibacillus larvae]AQT83490.1 hypothetical protein B1222_02040 [Paenibacillus larvae subsp. pulvifaciens]MCY9774339.1 FtsX-like permease family protein [Paenibacillus larvae]MEC0085101.1 FtsX-like permease family protein [Paenibacillus larvae]MEC0187594.1 FtsX-like permease family protein [Paenibacillus larvae]